MRGSSSSTSMGTSRPSSRRDGTTSPVRKTLAPRPRALTIAGSDSGGGAGIQADLKTFSALGVFGMTAITAVTVQNTLGVSGYEALSPHTVAEQIRAVVTDIGVDAAKTGMLASREIVEAVADTVAEAILALGPRAVLVKGGHLEGSTSADDLLVDAGRSEWIRGERLDTPHTHGTGCTLSAAIAAHPAPRAEVLDAGRARKGV